MWANKMYKVPDDEFPEHVVKEPEAKRFRVDSLGSSGSMRGNPGGMGFGKGSNGKGKGPKAGGKASNKAREKLCYEYNEGRCTATICPKGFAHKCWTCGGLHPASSKAGCH